jgi:hypothetical protein
MAHCSKPEQEEWDGKCEIRWETTAVHVGQ